jgi:hypothetical protein
MLSFSVAFCLIRAAYKFHIMLHKNWVPKKRLLAGSVEGGGQVFDRTYIHFLQCYPGDKKL